VADVIAHDRKKVYNCLALYLRNEGINLEIYVTFGAHMNRQSQHKTLTMQEYDALRDRQYNLADAHPRYQPVHSQRDVLVALGLDKIWSLTLNVSYEELIQNFKHAFYTLAKQTTALELKRDAMLCFSASECIDIIANFIQSKGLKVALMEPVFDSVSGTLKAKNTKLFPLPEERLKEIDSYFDEFGVEAIWITLPNNPTGMTLSEAEFLKLVAACKKRDILLVIDFCFRFFNQDMARWDQYAILEESGVTYATIEDTGKTWPVQELKIGIVQSSLNIYENLFYYYDNRVLSISNITLLALTEFIRDTEVNGSETTIYAVPNRNREIVNEYITDTILEDVSESSSMPIAWLRIADSSPLDAVALCELCKQKHIHLLPGPNFFWHDNELGRRYLRISLGRNSQHFKVGMRGLRNILHDVEKHQSKTSLINEHAYNSKG
jgi:aspartate/methionine/tyrosine aminotransferase